MTVNSSRPLYRPSGKFRPLRLTLVAVVLVGVSVMLAFCGAAMVQEGIYVLGGTAIFSAMFIGMLSWGGIKWSHCRNCYLAAGLTACCSLAGYLGHYHLDQAVRWQVPIQRIDRLPGYIAFRMATDQWRIGGRLIRVEALAPQPGILPWRSLAEFPLTIKWLGFLAEVVICTGAATASAWLGAGQPYSEGRRRWCRREVIFFPAEARAELEHGLKAGGLAACLAKYACKVPQGGVATYIWFASGKLGDAADGAVFMGTDTIYQLSTDEIAALSALIPDLQQSRGIDRQQLAARADESGDRSSARVWPVPPAEAGLAMSLANRLIGAGIAVGLMLVPPLAMGSLLVGFVLFVTPQAQQVVPDWLPGVCVVAGAIGLGLVMASPTFLKKGPERAPYRFLEMQLARALSRRLDPLVAPGDPAAIVAEMKPREQWRKDFPGGQTNLGLMLVEEDRQIIAFEGDRERYWIPAEAIVGAHLESAAEHLPGPTTPWAVVLRVRLGDGVWELPLFAYRGLAGETELDWATALLDRIQSLRPNPSEAEEFAEFTAAGTQSHP